MKCSVCMEGGQCGWFINCTNRYCRNVVGKKKGEKTEAMTRVLLFFVHFVLKDFFFKKICNNKLEIKRRAPLATVDGF